MKQVTMEEFVDRTVLLPEVVAETVCAGRRIADWQPFAVWAVARTLTLYNVNADWRRKMDSRTGRDWLYAFMNHWLDAWVDDAARCLARMPVEPLTTMEVTR